MKTIRTGDTGAAVEDVQQRLVTVGYLQEGAIDGVFGDMTAAAVRRFREDSDLDSGDEVDEKTWSALVDASYHIGDRTLYLRMPYFHGHDVLELQQALGALGFSSGREDGIFGAYTEDGVRKFQRNMGLPSDGIVGAYTFAAIRNLHHSWEGKKSIPMQLNLGFARAADVLERHALCLFGTDEFTRGVASRMSNLSIATNPASKIVSADSLLVPPDESMLLVHITLPDEDVVEERVQSRRYPGIEDEARYRSGLSQDASARDRRASRFDMGRCGRGALDAALRNHASGRPLRRAQLSGPMGTVPIGPLPSKRGAIQ